jgi:hypothetical protein
MSVIGVIAIGNVTFETPGSVGRGVAVVVGWMIFLFLLSELNIYAIETALRIKSIIKAIFLYRFIYVFP